MKRNDIVDVDSKIYFQNYENLFNVYSDNVGNYFYNISRKVNIPDELDPETYETYTIEAGDTWTALSYMYYGSVHLWWILLAANSNQNPLALPVPGVSIRVLNPSVVQSILVSIRSAE